LSLKRAEAWGLSDCFSSLDSSVLGCWNGCSLCILCICICVCTVSLTFNTAIYYKKIHMKISDRFPWKRPPNGPRSYPRPYAFDDHTTGDQLDFSMSSELHRALVHSLTELNAACVVNQLYRNGHGRLSLIVKTSAMRPKRHNKR
jgi:hypothetical protein